MLNKVKAQSENWTLDWLPHYVQAWMGEIGWEIVGDVTKITIESEILSGGKDETGYECFEPGRYWIVTIERREEHRSQMFERATGRKAYINVFTAKGDFLGLSPDGCRRE